MIHPHIRAVVNYATDLGGIVRAGRWPSISPTILMYHRVGSEDWAIGPEAYTVSRDELAADLDRLTTHATVVPLARLVDWLAGDGMLPADSVVLTFDDGYRDIVTTVAPLLERYEAPATVYVSTGCVANSRSPFAFRLLAALRELDSVSVRWDGERIDAEMSTAENVNRIYDRLYATSKWAASEERSRLLSCLGADDPEPIPMLRPDDIAALSASELVTVGSHGHAHVPLAIRNESAVRRDLDEADRLLANWTGSSPEHFSYPYGSVEPTVRRIVADRYLSAVGTDTRCIRPRDWHRPHELPRFDSADRTRWERHVARVNRLNFSQDN